LQTACQDLKMKELLPQALLEISQIKDFDEIKSALEIFSIEIKT